MEIIVNDTNQGFIEVINATGDTDMKQQVNDFLESRSHSLVHDIKVTYSIDPKTQETDYKVIIVYSTKRA
jgi:hypothetical protein